MTDLGPINTAGCLACPDWLSPTTMRTVSADEVKTVREVIDPLIELAKDYLKEPRNGALFQIAVGAVDPGDHRAVLAEAVRDFVTYVAHRHRTALHPSAWKREP